MYTWIFITGILFAFYNAWGGGANDCANSFATAVGSKVLTLKQAILIASVFEFSGAVLMGSHVTNTVRKKIVSQTIFEDDPGALMLGMLCAELSSALWLTLATYLKWPVSTTHSIIGSIIGFSIVYGGTESINWDKVGEIALSWVISPLLACVFSFLSFNLIKKFIFESKRPYINTQKIYPGLTFFTFFINSLFIIYKGSPQLELDELEVWKCVLISLGIGIFTAIVSWKFYLPYAVKKVDRLYPDEVEDTSNPQEEMEVLSDRTESYVQAIDGELCESNTDVVLESPVNQEIDNDNSDNVDGSENGNSDDLDLENNLSNAEEENNNNFTYDENLTLQENINESKKLLRRLKDKQDTEKMLKLHNEAFDINPKADKLCSWLQIFTSCFSSFAHGSNDVANAIAPLATIYAIYQNNGISSRTEVPIWILVLGGVGIVFGLATWGYKIIKKMGKQLTKISPSRGFIIELSAATTIIIASRAEMPVSTTHCQVGSIVGCGLTNGKKNVKWSLLKGVLFSWLITLPVTGFLSAGLFSYGFYSPSTFTNQSLV